MQDVHSRKLQSPLILTHSEPALVLQAQEHSTSTGAEDLIDTVVGTDLETVVLKNDEKTGMLLNRRSSVCVWIAAGHAAINLITSTLPVQASVSCCIFLYFVVYHLVIIINTTL